MEINAESFSRFLTLWFLPGLLEFLISVSENGLFSILQFFRFIPQKLGYPSMTP